MKEISIIDIRQLSWLESLQNLGVGAATITKYWNGLENISVFQRQRSPLKKTPPLSFVNWLSFVVLFFLSFSLLFLIYKPISLVLSTIGAREQLFKLLYLSRTFFYKPVGGYHAVLQTAQPHFTLWIVFYLTVSILCIVASQVLFHYRGPLPLDWNQMHKVLPSKLLRLSYWDDSFQRVKVILPLPADAL